MPRLEDSEVADEYGPDRFMPREVDGEREAEVRDELTHKIAFAISHAHERNECLPLTEADAVRAWLRQHDAEVAAKALTLAANTMPNVVIGRQWLMDRAARIRREAGLTDGQ